MRKSTQFIVGVCLATGLLAVFSLRSQTTAPPGATVPAVLRTNADVGPVKQSGSVVREGGRREVRGGGFGVQGTEDSFQFDYRPLFGDGEIVARVILNDPAPGGAGAGVILRQSLAADAAGAAIWVTPTNGLSLQWREQTGEPAVAERAPIQQVNATNRFWKLAPSRAWQAKSPSGLATANAELARAALAPQLAGKPSWVKLTRRGDAVSAWWSPNNKDWKWLGTREITLPHRVFVGAAVNSHHFNKLASARFSEVKVRPWPVTEAALSNATLGGGTGLRGTYFDTATSNRVSRLVLALDFHWPKGPPLPQFRKGNFTARWSDFLEARHSELHALEVVTGGGVRLWLDGRKVLDDWEAPADGAVKTVKALVRLEAGRKHRLRVEYADEPKRSSLKLLWSSPSTPRQVVPQSQLYPPDWEKAPLATAAESLPLSGPWLQRDVGRVRQPGNATATDTGFRVEGGGFDLAGNADEFHFVYQPWNGDGEIVARVAGDAAAQYALGAKAGVMIRESLAPDSANVSLTVTHASGIRFEQRLKSSEQATEIERAKVGDTWVKLIRRRAIFTAYTSADGVTWNWLGKTEVPMSTNLYIGLVVASRKYGQSYRAHFDQVAVRGLQPGTRLLAGSGDGLGAVYYDGATSNTVARTDAKLNFAWGRHFPDERIGRAPFTARWQGLLEATHSEPYHLHLISDGPARVWLDGKLVLDEWKPHSLRETKARVNLLAGHRYPVQIEYAAQRNAHLRLLWSGPSTPKRPIPASQFYSPAHPFFREIEDKDRDSLPDAWERLHGLNEFDAADAAADPDQDGLTNLAEYLLGTNPRKADTDGDGLSDGWEAKYNLNPLKLSAVSHDTDLDGLSDHEEFLAGTDPTKADTDGGGLPDWIEVKETGTDANVADDLKVATVAEVTGARAINQVGRWVVLGQSIQANDRRGALEFALTTGQPGMFRLEIEGGAGSPYDTAREYPLRVWLDGESLGRRVLRAEEGRNGFLHIFTPWLRPGEHRVRLLWDNVAGGRVLRLAAIRLQELSGADANANGVSDWVESRLRNSCTVEAGSLSSAVSPACLEGRAAHLGLMTLSGGIIPQPAPEGRWFANVPLSPDAPQTVIASFQNDGLLLTNRVTWRPTDVLTASDLTIRQGDALLLTAGNTGESDALMSITVDGATRHTGKAGETIVHRFDKPGTFTVSASVGLPRGGATNRSIQVTVVAARFTEAPAAWAGKGRAWSGPEVTGKTHLDTDRRLTLEPGAAGGWRLTTDAPEQRHLLARTDTNGPVLAGTRVDGFRVYSGSRVYLRRTELYADGSQLIEMGLVVSPVVPDVTVRVQTHAGGVTFDDGTVLKELTVADFDELGQAVVRFLKPASAKTSVCHRTTVWQGVVFLGEHWSSEETGP
jgi:hypothetical protein